MTATQNQSAQSTSPLGCLCIDEIAHLNRSIPTSSTNTKLDVRPWTQLICDGDYNKILRDPRLIELVQYASHDAKCWEDAFVSVQQAVNEAVKRTIPENGQSASLESQYEGNIDHEHKHKACYGWLPIDILNAAIAFLEAFIQSNFCGPFLPLDLAALTPKVLRSSTASDSQEMASDEDKPMRIPSIAINDATVVENIDILKTNKAHHVETAEAASIWLKQYGQYAYDQIPRAWLLVLAQAFADSSALDSLASAPLWKARCKFVIQRMLDEISEQLLLQIEAGILSAITIVGNFRKQTSQKNISFDVGKRCASLKIELALVYVYYGRDMAAMNFVNDAARNANLQWVLTGRLGRRTKFQKFDTSQLVVLAKSDDPGPIGEQQHDNQKIIQESIDNSSMLDDVNDQAKNSTVPEALLLNDDTLLENIKFSKPATIDIHESDNDIPLSLRNIDPNNQPRLDPLQGAILLGFAHCIHNTNPMDGITMEQMAPFCARVLEQPLSWTIHSSALLQRAKLEASRSRTIERSILQIQVLVDQLLDELESTPTRSVSINPQDENHGLQSRSFLSNNVNNSAPARERLSQFYQVLVPSKWALEADLAQRYFNIGMTRSAVEIYERLKMYPDIARCYACLGESQRASSILRQQLDLNPTSAKLWTMLGEVENNADHYNKAWEVSGHRYAKAQRMLGQYFISKQDYARAMNAYKASIEISPLVHAAWYNLGFCAIQQNEWSTAEKAFSRCVKIESQDAESWSNLALCILQNDQVDKRRAWKSLEQAARINFESWKIWENFSIISIEMKEWMSVCRALSHIIDLKKVKEGESAINQVALQTLFQAIKKGDLKDQYLLEKQFNSLVDLKVVPLITDKASLWDLVSSIYIWREMYTEALEALGKAYRCEKHKYDIQMQLESWNNLADSASRYSEALKLFGGPKISGSSETQTVQKNWIFKARSVLRSARTAAISGGFDDTDSFKKIENELELLKTNET